MIGVGSRRTATVPLACECPRLNGLQSKGDGHATQQRPSEASSDFSHELRDRNCMFVLPSRIAARLNRRLAIAFDEFQAIGSFNGGSVEQALRAAVQQQRQVGYVFAGSEPTLMEQMIGPRRPFYKAGPVMRLGKIPPDLFAEFVDDRFKRSGFVPEAGFGTAVVDLAGNLPYDVQRLAHETWDDVQRTRRRSVGLDDLHTTLHRLLSEHDTFFETMWLRLTLAQRGVLRAVVIEQGVEILSAETRSRHRLGVASSVQAALGALLKNDLIAREDDGRYVVIDSLMREWVARRTYLTGALSTRLATERDSCTAVIRDGVSPALREAAPRNRALVRSRFILRVARDLDRGTSRRHTGNHAIAADGRRTALGRGRAAPAWLNACGDQPERPVR